MAELDELKQRLADIFGTENVPSVDTETRARYLDYLKQHLELPCQLTGIEDMGVRPISVPLPPCHSGLY